jgi:phosphoglycolate phosphatase
VNRAAARAIFLDLDGPLLDVAPRYHRLHRDLVLHCGGTPLEAAKYWQLKREQVPEEDISILAGISPSAATGVATARLRRIERQRYLRFDRLWPWTSQMLEALAQLAPLFLVSARHHPERLHRQLEELGLAWHFAAVVAGPGDGTLEAKARLLREAGLSWAPGSALVGDTEVDVASGQALGLTTIALSCGLRSAGRLAAWRPDLLLDDLREVPACLAHLGWTATWRS